MLASPDGFCLDGFAEDIEFGSTVKSARSLMERKS
jgi:hypothetical protein